MGDISWWRTMQVANNNKNKPIIISNKTHLVSEKKFEAKQPESFWFSANTRTLHRPHRQRDALMPPANNIGFPATSDMVTTAVSVQTSCPSSPSHSNFYNSSDDNDDICPNHFTDIHRCKLEDTFSRKQKPDDIQLQIIAMECNLLYKDVRDWFRKRRLKWLEELVRNETATSQPSDSRRRSIDNSESNNYYQQNYIRRNNTSPMLSSDSNNNLPDPVVYTGKHKNQQNSKHHNNTKDLSLKNNKNSVSANGIINHHDVTTT